MKPLIPLLLLFLAGSTLYARPIRPTEVPAAVLHQLDSLFPEKDTVFWDKANKTYRADFFHAGRNISLTFHKKGTLLYSRVEIDPSIVPHVIQNKLANEFRGMKIKMAFVSKHEGKTGYDLQIMAGSLVYLVKIIGDKEIDYKSDIDKLEFENPEWLGQAQ